MFDAVLFDLDETLIHDEAVGRHAFVVTAYELTQDEARAQQLGMAAFQHALALWKTMAPIAIEYGQRIGHSAVEGLWADYDVSIPAEAQLQQELARIRPEIWRLALKDCGLSGDATKLEARWRALRHAYPLYSDTDRVLATLRPKTKLGIVTNGVQGLQRKKLNGSGLLHWFDAVAVSGEVRIGKPDPGIFQWIADQLGVDVKRCVMVGDNPDRDVLGGKNAGMKTAWVDRGHATRHIQADVVGKSLSELLPFLLGR